MSPAELQTLMPEDLLALIGAEGVWITAIVYAVVIFIFSVFHYTYKASFFSNRASGATRLGNTEYDEKGQ